MKTFAKVAAQGEITIRRLPDKLKIREGFRPVAPVNGQYVIGHSETGHNHVIDAGGMLVAEMDRPPQGMRILHLIAKDPFVLEHLRDYDTHEPITGEPGNYEVRIAREYDPYEELARISAD